MRLLLLIAAAAAAVVAGCAHADADAQATVEHIPTEVIAWQAPLVVDDAVAASYGLAPACDFTCDNTARRLECSAGQRYDEIVVWNAACAAGTCTPSATPVFIGGALNMTTSTGIPVCNTTGCISTFADLEVKGAMCITQAATVHVTIQVAQ